MGQPPGYGSCGARAASRQHLPGLPGVSFPYRQHLPGWAWGEERVGVRVRSASLLSRNGLVQDMRRGGEGNGDCL